jgi:molybdenum cofactor cytidylyltransferase
MGQPKLLLPWEGSTVIARMLAVLARPEITEILVVVRPGDEPLKNAVERAGATPLQPAKPPAEMRQSVEYALRHLESQWSPAPDDGWLLIPADYPLLDPVVLDLLLATWQTARDKIIIPQCGGRRGHPTIFPFSLAEEVYRLPADLGLNHLVRSNPHHVLEIEIVSPGIFTDLDTPEEYARLFSRSRSRD